MEVGGRALRGEGRDDFEEEVPSDRVFLALLRAEFLSSFGIRCMRKDLVGSGRARILCRNEIAERKSFMEEAGYPDWDR